MSAANAPRNGRNTGKTSWFYQAIAQTLHTAAKQIDKIPAMKGFWNYVMRKLQTLLRD
jgi:hypothetical protein